MNRDEHGDIYHNSFLCCHYVLFFILTITIHPLTLVAIVMSLCSLFQSYDQKNIRRRVYDALNVLMAMNIISKEKKEIKWVGLPTNSAQECAHLEVSY